MLGTADPLWQKASQKASALGQQAALDLCASRVAGEALNKNLLMLGSFGHNKGLAKPAGAIPRWAREIGMERPMAKASAKVGVETFLAVIIQCAILTVGLLKQEFRQKDVMFYLDLIKDIVHRGHLGRSIDIQFIQIQRWLSRYEELGWVSSRREAHVTTFRMKIAGFRGLLRALAAEDQLLEIPDALLIQQILDAYGPYLKERVLKEKSTETAQNQAFRQLLRPAAVFDNQIRLLDQVIAQHERRSNESLRLQAYCQAALARGEDPGQIARTMPSEFSYQLSRQKTFRELLQDIPETLRDFEIQEGFEQRHRRFYGPYLAYLKLQRNFYLEMRGDPHDSAGG